MRRSRHLGAAARSGPRSPFAPGSACTRSSVGSPSWPCCARGSPTRAAGSPQVVQIQGPPGIGKTALLDHFLADPGAGRAARSSCGPAARRPRPCWPTASSTSSPVGGRPGRRRPARARRRLRNRAVGCPVTVGTRLLELLGGLEADVAGRPRRRRRRTGPTSRRSGADLRAAPARRRPGPRRCSPCATTASPELPESLRRLVTGAAGQRAAAARARRARSLARPRRGDGPRRRSPSGAAARLRVRHAGKPAARPGAARGVPAAPNGSRGEQSAAVAAVVPAAGRGPLRRLPAPTPGGSSTPPRCSGRTARCRWRRRWPRSTDRWPPSTRRPRRDLLVASTGQLPWTRVVPASAGAVRACYDALGPARRHGPAHRGRGAGRRRGAPPCATGWPRPPAPDADARRRPRPVRRRARRSARRWPSAAAHLVAGSPAELRTTGEEQRVLLVAVIWMLQTRRRRDGRRPSPTRSGGFPAGPLRDSVLGPLAMARRASRPSPRCFLRQRLGALRRRTTEPEVAATIALQYGDPPVRAAGRRGRPSSGADRALERHRRRTRPRRQTAQTYLAHGLGYAGRIAESFAATAAADGGSGRRRRLVAATRARPAGMLRLVDGRPRRRPRRSRVGRDDGPRARRPQHGRVRLRLPGPRRIPGGRLGRRASLHAERAVAINDESDFGFMQAMVVGIAALVPAARGEWAVAEADPGGPAAAQPGDYERSVVALAVAGPGWRGPRRCRASARGARAGAATSRSATRSTSRGSGPGRTSTPRRWSATGRVDEADAFLVPHEERAAQRGRRSADRPAGPGPGPGGGGRRAAPTRAEAAFARALAAARGGRRSRSSGREVELAAGQFLRRAGQRRRAADLLTVRARDVRGARAPRRTRSGAPAELAGVRAGPTPRRWPRPGRADVAGTGRRPAGGGGPEQPGDRRRTGGQHQDRGVPPAQRVREARRDLRRRQLAARLVDGRRRPADGRAFPLHGTSPPRVACAAAPPERLLVCQPLPCTSELADELWEADRTAKPIAPLTERHPDLGIEDAYAIQTINIDRRVAAGQRIIGRKVGLTSQPMQKLLGVDEPDFGVLTDEMFVEDGDLIALSRLVQPRVEAELAFVMETRPRRARGHHGRRALRRHRRRAAGGGDRRQPGRRLEDQAGRHRRGQRLVRAAGGRRADAPGGRPRPAAARRGGLPARRGDRHRRRRRGARQPGALRRLAGQQARQPRRRPARPATSCCPARSTRWCRSQPGDVFRAEFAHLGAVTVRFSNGTAVRRTA